MDKKIFHAVCCFFAACCFLVSCSDGQGKKTIVDSVIAGYIPYTAQNCTVDGQNEFVYRVLTDTYLWYDTVPQADPSAFDTPEDLLANLRYAQLDRWSYIAEQNDYYAYYEEGRYIGLGFAMIHYPEGDVRIMYVYAGSPADQIGMERGDRLLEVNGETVEEIESGNRWEIVLGPDNVGVRVDLLLEKPDGRQIDATLEKAWIDINTVLYHDIIDNLGVKTGYLFLSSFLMTSLDELTPVFERFKQEGVTELVLDLRYNGGGRTVVAKYLADLIAGKKADNGIFTKYIHNDAHTEWDNSIRFSAYPISLDVERVSVIASELTASASELIINGLKPFVDVVVVGTTTSGKPVGMYGHDFCDKHLSLIEFKVANANDEGDYFDGIPPDCAADDDVDRQFGDLEEDSLKEALYFLANGECSAGRTYTADVKQELTYKIRNRKELRRYGLQREIGAF